MIKTPLTGAAQPVTDSVKRAMDYLKGKPDPRGVEQPRPGDPNWRPHGRKRLSHRANVKSGSRLTA